MGCGFSAKINCGQFAGATMSSLVPSQSAVDDDRFDTLGRLRRRIVSRLIDDGGGVKHDNVSMLP
jgi:hypothetical protein